jgi:hypothetical protein
MNNLLTILTNAPMSETVRMAAGRLDLLLVQRTARALALRRSGAEVIAADGE